jgi:hypothetical protein
MNEREFEKRANLIARQFAPPIRTCAECGWPVLKGYCCNHCGNTDPSMSFAQQEEDSSCQTEIRFEGPPKT